MTVTVKVTWIYQLEQAETRSASILAVAAAVAVTVTGPGSQGILINCHGDRYICALSPVFLRSFSARHSEVLAAAPRPGRSRSESGGLVGSGQTAGRPAVWCQGPGLNRTGRAGQCSPGPLPGPGAALRCGCRGGLGGHGRTYFRHGVQVKLRELINPELEAMIAHRVSDGHAGALWPPASLPS